MEGSNPSCGTIHKTVTNRIHASPVMRDISTSGIEMSCIYSDPQNPICKSCPGNIPGGSVTYCSRGSFSSVTVKEEKTFFLKGRKSYFISMTETEVKTSIYLPENLQFEETNQFKSGSSEIKVKWGYFFVFEEKDENIVEISIKEMGTSSSKTVLRTQPKI